jgi:hypothetical protein
MEKVFLLFTIVIFCSIVNFTTSQTDDCQFDGHDLSGLGDIQFPTLIEDYGSSWLFYLRLCIPVDNNQCTTAYPMNLGPANVCQFDPNSESTYNLGYNNGTSITWSYWRDADNGLLGLIASYAPVVVDYPPSPPTLQAQTIAYISCTSDPTNSNWTISGSLETKKYTIITQSVYACVSPMANNGNFQPNEEGIRAPQTGKSKY